MNILIVEDDVYFAGHLSKALLGNEIVHRVDIVSTLAHFIAILPVLEGYDIILTDLNLSQDTHNSFDGFYIIRTIRDLHIRVPILVISGRDAIAKIQGAFEIGANDYILKGMRMRELELRILHWYKYFHLSRLDFDNKNHYEYKQLSYSIQTNEFFIENQSIPLTKSNKKMLSIFFIHAETLLSESFLICKLWGDITLDIERNIRIQIYRLRFALAPFGIDTWIQTRHGEGYIFLKTDHLSLRGSTDF